MKTLQKLFPRVMILVLCAVFSLSTVGLFQIPSNAAAAFSLTSSSVADGAFSVTLSFPDVSWGGFTFVLTYDKSIVQLTSDPSMPTSQPMIYAAPSSEGNANGTMKIAGGGTTDVSGKNVTVVMPFKIVDTNAKTVQISIAVEKFILKDNTPVSATAPSPVTVTLKTEPPVSTDTNTGSSSTVTETNTSSNTDTGSTNTSTDTGSNSNTNTNTNTNTGSNTNTGTNSSTKTDESVKTESEKTDTTDTGTATDTGSVTDENSDVTSTDPAASTDSGSDLPVWSTVITGKPTQKPGTGSDGWSVGNIAAISLAIAAVFCGAMTTVALLRHKRA